MLPVMLHTSMFTATGERRADDRAPCPGEVVMFWLHDPDLSLRYRLLDVGDSGYRIRSVTPVLDGTTGVVTRLLPEGTAIDRAVAVAWSRLMPDGNWDVGLRVI